MVINFDCHKTHVVIFFFILLIENNNNNKGRKFLKDIDIFSVSEICDHLEKIK